MGLAQAAGPDQLAAAVIGDIRILSGVPGYRVQGREKDEAQGVLPRTEAGFDRHPPGAVHIIEKSDALIIQEQLRLRIHALKNQIRAGAGQGLLREGEGALHGKGLAGGLADRVLIHAIKGIGDGLMIQEGLQEGAGDTGIKTPAVFRRQGPGAAEILGEHGRSTSDCDFRSILS